MGKITQSQCESEVVDAAEKTILIDLKKKKKSNVWQTLLSCHYYHFCYTHYINMQFIEAVLPKILSSRHVYSAPPLPPPRGVLTICLTDRLH